MQVEGALLQPLEEGFTQLFIVNPSGFTQVAEEGCITGKAEAVLVASEEDQVQQLESSAEPEFTHGSMLRVALDLSDDMSCKAQLMEATEEPDLPDAKKRISVVSWPIITMYLALIPRIGERLI